MPSKADKIKLSRQQDRRTKFTDKQIEEMRELYANGSMQKAIAEVFECSQSTVCYIVSETAHKNLAEYRKINPPKRRTTEEAREYMKNLRKYKKAIMNKDCAKCKHSTRIDDISHYCDAKEYDIENLSCFVPKDDTRTPQNDEVRE